jgi:hypothetical protein
MIPVLFFILVGCYIVVLSVTIDAFHSLSQVMIPRNVCDDCGWILDTEAEYSAHTAIYPQHKVRREEKTSSTRL